MNRRGGRDRARRAVVAAGTTIVALTFVAISASAAATTGQRFPAVATTVPPTTPLVTTTVATPATTSTIATQATTSTIATTTSVTLPKPESEAVDPVRTLVPAITVVPAVLTEAVDRRTAIDTALANGGTTVAVEAEPGTLCAVVPVTAPVMAEGRWERNGEAIGSTATNSAGSQRRDPPGFGDCLTNPNGEAFDEAVYQYVAIGATGATSAAASVVVGVAPIDVWLVNNGDEPVCLVLMSPTRADYYEAHDTDSPLLPGEAISIPAAPVEHDVQVFGCPPDDTLRTFQITPEPQSYVDMFDDDDDSAPSTTPTPTTTTPTTTTPTTT